MITVPELASDALGAFLAAYMQRKFGSSQGQLTETVPSIARIALDCIASSDALYHDVEHTMLVTLAGHDIFFGRALLGNVNASDYAHFIIACVMHDIGYCRGVLKGDGNDGYVVDSTGRKVSLPRGSSTPQWRPITSIGPRCSCWSDSRPLRNSTKNGSPMRSSLRDFQPP